jgi:hypothetical protein
MSQNLPYNLICAKKQQQKTLPNLFPGISVWKGGWDVNPHFPQEKITTASKIGPLGAKRESGLAKDITGLEEDCCPLPRTAALRSGPDTMLGCLWSPLERTIPLSHSP